VSSFQHIFDGVPIATQVDARWNQDGAQQTALGSNRKAYDHPDRVAVRAETARREQKLRQAAEGEVAHRLATEARERTLRAAWWGRHESRWPQAAEPSAQADVGPPPPPFGDHGEEAADWVAWASPNYRRAMLAALVAVLGESDRKALKEAL
jgi:hypothetical protein